MELSSNVWEEKSRSSIKTVKKDVIFAYCRMSYALNMLSGKSISLDNQMGDTGEENSKTLQTSYSLFNSKSFTIKLTCVDNIMFSYHNCA